MQGKGGIMIYVIAVFRSRNETLYLANILQRTGNRVMVINTPKEAGQACGISVRFEESYLSVVRNCLVSKPFRTFVGFFRIAYVQNKMKVERIG